MYFFNLVNVKFLSECSALQKHEMGPLGNPNQIFQLYWKSLDYSNLMTQNIVLFTKLLKICIPNSLNIFDSSVSRLERLFYKRDAISAYVPTS